MRVLLALLLVVLLFSCIEGRPRKSRGKCARRQKYFGCRLRPNTNRCSCGKARKCSNPFPYKSRKECKKFTRNVCKASQPCQHGGVCVVQKKNTYSCQCSGTGYYGNNCETVCPAHNPLSSQIWKYPTDCINI